MFPILTRASALIRRGAGEVQFGAEPGESVVVSGLSEVEIALLEHLDGSVTMDAIASRSMRLGQVVGDLVRLGVLGDAHTDWPVPASVVVVGHPASVEATTDLLRVSGVHVRGGQAALDDIDLARRACRSPLAGPRPDLVILVVEGAVRPEDRSAPADVPVLPVVLHHHWVQVGPVAGLPDGPCLLCLDLTRADHDPAWGHVLAQGDRLQAAAPTPAMTALAAALATTAALDHMQDRPVATSLEMSLDPPRAVRRAWSVHPRCPRHAASA